MAAPDLGAPNDPVGRFLALVDGVARSGNEWKALCPAHPDRNPSLSVRLGDNGAALVNCQVGCRTDDVLGAVGLQMRDLYPDGRDRPNDRWRGSGQPVAGARPTPVRPAAGERATGQKSPLGPVVARYTYVDEQGAELFTKTRHDPKTFRVRKAGGGSGIGDARRVLYRLPEVLAAVEAGQTVYLVEGEKDADRLAAMGFTATCNFDGAAKTGARAKWRSEYGDTLAGAHVVIVRDRDDAGAAHADAAFDDLSSKAATVRIVEPTTTAEHDDLTDHLDAGHSLEQLVPVRGPHIDAAEPDEAPSADLVQLRENDAAMATGYSPVDWDALFAAEDLDPDWLVPDILERGENAVIYAPAKTGKSLITLDMIAALASGRARLGRPAADPMRLLYVDMENSRRDLHRRLVAMGYTPDDLRTLIYLSFPGLPPLDTLRGGAELSALVRHHGADVVVLDSTSRVVDGPEQEADTYRGMYRHTIRLLKPLGTTIIRLDNSGKDATKGQRGSSAKADDIDVAWELTKQRGGTFRLRCTHDRSGVHPEHVHVERETDPLRHIVTAAPGPVSTESLHPAINALIDALDKAGAPDDVGRDRARAFLPEGVGARNQDLTEAVRARKQRRFTATPRDDVDDGQRTFEDGW